MHAPSTQPRTYLFAGGGTGGHIFPAIAIAEALRAAQTDSRIRFLCATRPLDTEILSREQLNGTPLDFEAVPAQPFGLRPRALVRFLNSWGQSVRAGRAAIRNARSGGGSVIVVAMGGFVAAPIAQAARVERAPVLLINLDAIPGKANRWIARRAARILSAAPLAPNQGGAGWQIIPPIVRAAATSTRSAAECRSDFGLEPGHPTLLVTGGSQGAGSINGLLGSLAKAPDSPLRGWQIIHQTGKDAAEAVRAEYAQAGVRAWVGAFISNMGEAWNAADAAVSRAGAGSVAEAWSARVPTVFLPYPYHADQHQRHNARGLVEAGGAVIVEDLVDPSANLARHLPVFQRLLMDESARHGMRQALEKLGPADGAARAVATLLDM